MVHVCRKCHETVKGERDIKLPALRTFAGTCEICDDRFVTVFHMAWKTWYQKYLAVEVQDEHPNERPVL
jgi:hypothetical protein